MVTVGLVLLALLVGYLIGAAPPTRATYRVLTGEDDIPPGPGMPRAGRSRTCSTWATNAASVRQTRSVGSLGASDGPHFNTHTGEATE